MHGIRIVVFGVANEQSIAWRVSSHLLGLGAEVHITYQQKFKSRVLQLSLLTQAIFPRCSRTPPQRFEALWRG